MIIGLDLFLHMLAEGDDRDDDRYPTGKGRPKYSDSSIYRHYVLGKLLPAELRSAFLAAIFARDGADLKMNAPHRVMNLWTLLAICKTMLNSALYTELRNELQDAMTLPGERYCHACLILFLIQNLLDGFSLLCCKQAELGTVHRLLYQQPVTDVRQHPQSNSAFHQHRAGCLFRTIRDV
jgi:hypothetical protein